MSRSRKKAFVTCSRRMADNVHSIARGIINARLRAIDPTEGDDIGLIDCDVMELGLVDWGTKFGVEFMDDTETTFKAEMRRK